MKVGRKLANKLLNVTKFVLGIGDVAAPATAAAATDPIDRSMLAKLDAVIAEATAAFEAFDYARALERTESFFWWFCDDYVELVKGRATARRATTPRHRREPRCASALDALQRLFAPFLPFATEEAWSWWHDGSVHVAAVAGADRQRRRPGAARRPARGARPRAPHQDRGQGQPAGRGRHRCTSPRPPTAHAAFEAGCADLLEAGSIRSTSTSSGVDCAPIGCEVELAPST